MNRQLYQLGSFDDDVFDRLGVVPDLLRCWPRWTRCLTAPAAASAPHAVSQPLFQLLPSCLKGVPPARSSRAPAGRDPSTCPRAATAWRRESWNVLVDEPLQHVAESLLLGSGQGGPLKPSLLGQLHEQAVGVLGLHPGHVTASAPGPRPGCTHTSAGGSHASARCPSCPARPPRPWGSA